MCVSDILLKCNSVFSYSMRCFGQKHVLNTKKITVILQGVFSDLCVARQSMDDNWGLSDHLLCQTRVAHVEQSPGAQRWRAVQIHQEHYFWLPQWCISEPSTCDHDLFITTRIPNWLPVTVRETISNNLSSYLQSGCGESDADRLSDISLQKKKEEKLNAQTM